MPCSLRRTLALFSAFTVAVSHAAPPTMFPPVRGLREMVGAANNQEVEAGFRILQQGGNAVDAGVAATFTAAVTEQSRFGMGGEMPVIIKMAGKPPIVISAVGVAPKKATVEFYKQRKAEPFEDSNNKPLIPPQGILSAITPGVVDGLLLALEEYGTMSVAQVLQPAIENAEGFPIAEEFARMLRDFRAIHQLWPSSTAFFYPDGAPPERGTIVRMPSLAKTLRAMVETERRTRGNRRKKIEAVRALMSKGDVAKRFAAFSEANGGLITLEDLAAYRAEVDQPRTVTYRGYEIHKPGFWTQGPVMLEALNILEGYDLKKMGHNSPEYLHTVIEAVKLAFADRDQHYGDPKFSKIPEAILLSKDYAAERRKLIDPKRASMESRPGQVPGGNNIAAMTSSPVQEAPIHDTTCVNVVDAKGNAFSATPSGAWLPSVIAGDTGIPFSSRLQSFVGTPGHPNQLAPGKRPRVTLSPTMVTRNGEFVFAMSTPGGDNQDQAMLQVLLNVIDFDMSPQEAVEAPRFQTEHFYASFAFHEFIPGKVNLESRIPPIFIGALEAMGHKVTVPGDWTNGSAPTLILKKDGVLHGGADPRRARFIFGR
ncbi:gamma-glutamyltranspeptidase [Bryobacterales bacterium F-183]|nr:gamma-glutamyltranspeptidase [Bryobacterales bacterium F-183]